MNECVNLLHNMSAPPKSVIKYEGLAGFAVHPIPGGSGVTAIKFKAIRRIYGTPVRFDLDPRLQGASVLDLIAAVGASEERGDPSQQLVKLINLRANELPLPDGCLVIKPKDSHRVLWTDPLSTLAVLSKACDTVWLRTKMPAISLALRRGSVSLLVPPGFTSLLPKV